MERIALEELLAEMRERLARRSARHGAHADDPYVLSDLLAKHGYVYQRPVL